MGAGVAVLGHVVGSVLCSEAHDLLDAAGNPEGSVCLTN